MTRANVFRTGGAFALTVGIGYTLCTLVFALFPEASANFMNALFHGLDFRVLKAPGTFTLGSFLYGLVVLVGWTFALGSVFGWLHEWLGSTGTVRTATVRTARP